MSGTGICTVIFIVSFASWMIRGVVVALGLIGIVVVVGGGKKLRVDAVSGHLVFLVRIVRLCCVHCGVC